MIIQLFHPESSCGISTVTLCERIKVRWLGSPQLLRATSQLWVPSSPHLLRWFLCEDLCWSTCAFLPRLVHTAGSLAGILPLRSVPVSVLPGYDPGTLRLSLPPDNATLFWNQPCHSSSIKKETFTQFSKDKHLNSHFRCIDQTALQSCNAGWQGCRP